MEEKFEKEVTDIIRWFNHELDYKPTILDVVDVIGREVDLFEQEYICTELKKVS